MISKVISGQSFGRLCAYLCKDQSRSVVLKSEGVRDYDYRLMGMDFERQRELNNKLKSPVLHLILSYYPGEKIADELMTQIAMEYLESLDIRNTQFVVVKHSDRQHLHTHIIVNRINNDGMTVKDNWIGLKGKKLAQSLTHKYGLHKAEKKTPELTQLERRSEYEVTRYEIYQHIHELLPACLDLDELKTRLAKLQVEMIYKYKGLTSEIQGVSFKKEGFKYKGSEIDRAFSFNNLNKSLSQKNALLPYALSKDKNQEKPSPRESHNHKDSKQMIWLLENLLRPEKSYDEIPRELLKKKRRRRL